MTAVDFMTCTKVHIGRVKIEDLRLLVIQLNNPPSLGTDREEFAG